jgi:hypothetical protein
MRLHQVILLRKSQIQGDLQIYINQHAGCVMFNRLSQFQTSAEETSD